VGVLTEASGELGVAVGLQNSGGQLVAGPAWEGLACRLGMDPGLAPPAQAQTRAHAASGASAPEPEPLFGTGAPAAWVQPRDLERGPEEKLGTTGAAA
jgi:hypothetical protein